MKQQVKLAVSLFICFVAPYDRTYVTLYILEWFQFSSWQFVYTQGKWRIYITAWFQVALFPLRWFIWTNLHMQLWIPLVSTNARKQVGHPPLGLDNSCRHSSCCMSGKGMTYLGNMEWSLSVTGNRRSLVITLWFCNIVALRAGTVRQSRRVDGTEYYESWE